MKIEITVNGKTIKAYVKDKDIKGLIKDDEEVPDVLWRAKEGEKYFYIYSNGIVGTEKKSHNQMDNDIWELGNYYRTVEEANKEIEKRKAIMRIRRYAAEKWGEFVPNWSDHNQVKFHIYYDHKKQNFNKNSNHYIQNKSFIYFEDIEHIEEVIKNFESDLKLIFNLTSSLK